MSISGLVIHTPSESTPAVAAELARIDGVEVHAAEDGRIVVTVDQENDGEAGKTISGLQGVKGVLSVSLVYSHFDEPSAVKEQADESI
jgi:periplasmic nitrate reductase NapD